MLEEGCVGGTIPSASGPRSSPEHIVDTSDSSTPVIEVSEATAAEGITGAASTGAIAVQLPLTLSNIIAAAIGAMMPSNVYGVSCSLITSSTRAAGLQVRREKSEGRANRRNNS